MKPANFAHGLNGRSWVSEGGKLQICSLASLDSRSSEIAVGFSLESGSLPDNYLSKILQTANKKFSQCSCDLGSSKNATNSGIEI
jgi:hypothetical protein